MELLEAIRLALDEKAILFVGSGFGYGAVNINGRPFVTGNGLRDALLEELGRDPHSTSASLSTVSNYFQKTKTETELMDFLKNKDVNDIHQMGEFIDDSEDVYITIED